MLLLCISVVFKLEDQKLVKKDQGDDVTQNHYYYYQNNNTQKILSLQNTISVDYEMFKLYLVEKYKLNKETTEFYRRDVW
jgi:hypothetical protein